MSSAKDLQACTLKGRAACNVQLNWKLNFIARHLIAPYLRDALKGRTFPLFSRAWAAIKNSREDMFTTVRLLYLTYESWKRWKQCSYVVHFIQMSFVTRGIWHPISTESAIQSKATYGQQCMAANFKSRPSFNETESDKLTNVYARLCLIIIKILCSSSNQAR